jgi:ssDNA-binding Zn-finger/Zn-ribbon topoisomerase 1
VGISEIAEAEASKVLATCPSCGAAMKRVPPAAERWF